MTGNYSEMFLDRCSRRTPEALLDAILCTLMFSPTIEIQEVRTKINLQLEKNKLRLVGVDEFAEALYRLQSDGLIELNIKSATT